MSGIARKACPVCGGRITVGWDFQYSIEHRVLRTGKLSKSFTKTSAMQVDGSHAACFDCGAFWDDNDFYIDDDLRFIDRKYKEEDK